MKAILALGLLAAVCCAGAAAVAGVKLGTPPTAADNKRFAKRDAARLLALFVAPRGAVHLRHEPVGDRGFLRSRPFAIGGRNVYRRTFWRVNERLDSVAAFVKAHPPTKSARPGGNGTSRGSGIPPNRAVDFAIQGAGGRRPLRWMEVTMSELPHGATGIRVDVAAGWIVPRSPSEKVPAGVREIEFRTRHRETRVTQPKKVQTIVRWFDALGIVQGGPVFHCPAVIGGRRVTLNFRSSSRRLLARAVLSSARISTECSPIGFSIRGRPQTPLVGLRFWSRVKRLIGRASP